MPFLKLEMEGCVKLLGLLVFFTFGKILRNRIAERFGFCSHLNLKKPGPVFIFRGEYITKIIFYNSWKNW